MFLSWFMHISKSQQQLIGSLQIKKYRLKKRQYVIEGYTLIKEAFDNNADFNFVLYSKRILEKSNYAALMNSMVQTGVLIFWASDNEMKKLSGFETSDGILAVMNMPKNDEEFIGDKTNNNIIVCLENISDPGNMGTIIRTCDWFGVKTVICAPNCVDIYNPKALRGTMGSIFHLRVIVGDYFENTLESLKRNNYYIVGTSLQTNISVLDVKKTKKLNNLAIILGNETHGISKNIEKVCDFLVRIEKFGKAESLNVGVACGIILNQLRV